MPGTDFNLRAVAYSRQHTVQDTAAASGTAQAESKSGFGFSDLLDIVNPLQHIPVVSTLYKHLTGDTIGTPEKIAGDTLYGGLVGFLSSVGDAIFTEATGKSFGDTVYAALFEDGSAATTGVASNGNTPDTAPVPQLALADDSDTAALRYGALTDDSQPKASPMQVAAAYRAHGRLLEAY